MKTPPTQSVPTSTTPMNPPTQSNATPRPLPKAYQAYLDRRECPHPVLWREALQACLDSGQLAPLTPNTIKLVRDALTAADDNARNESELRLENVQLRAKIGGLRAELNAANAALSIAQ